MSHYVPDMDHDGEITGKDAGIFHEMMEEDERRSADSGGCYVATCVYGSYDCPQVWTLRRFRDDMLAQTAAGRAFIRLYYAVSPVLVKRFGHTVRFRRFWRSRLDRLVGALRQHGVEDTPYRDKPW